MRGSEKTKANGARRHPVQPAAQKSTKMAVGLRNIRCSSSFDHAAELLCLPPCVPLIEGPRKPTPTLKTPAPTRGNTELLFITEYHKLDCVVITNKREDSDVENQAEGTLLEIMDSMEKILTKDKGADVHKAMPYSSLANQKIC